MLMVFLNILQLLQSLLLLMQGFHVDLLALDLGKELIYSLGERIN